MPQKMMKPPNGLLELLRLKSTGAGPAIFGDELTPTVDTRYHYAQDILETQAGPQTIGALGGAGLSDVLTLPAGVGLHAVGGALTIGAAAGTNLTIAVCINVRTLAVSIPLYNFFVPSFVAAQVIEFGRPLPPWVLPAGTRLFARACGTAAGADHAINVACLIEDFSNL